MGRAAHRVAGITAPTPVSRATAAGTITLNISTWAVDLSSPRASRKHSRGVTSPHAWPSSKSNRRYGRKGELLCFCQIRANGDKAGAAARARQPGYVPLSYVVLTQSVASESTGCGRQRRVDAAPADVARVLGALESDDVRIGIRWVGAALLRSSDQHGLWRFEPQPDKRDRRGCCHVLDDLTICCPGVHCVDNGAMTSASRQSGPLGQSRVDALGHLR